MSDCLRDKGVKSILVVMVDDEPTVSDNSEASHTLPHTDEAIERSLKGFGIEIWNWKKTDTFSEVI